MEINIIKQNKTIKHFRNLLVFSGIFNIVCASPLALPVVYSHYLKLLNLVAQILNLGGLPTTISNNPTHAFFVNIAGLHLVLTGVIVLFASKNPSSRYMIALFNGIGRTVFFIIIIYLSHQYNISKIWLAFAILDFCISFAFVHYVKKIKKSSNDTQNNPPTIKPLA